MKKIEVTIGLDGSVHMDAQGFTGKTCEEATDKLKILIGGNTESSKKPDYYAPAASTAVGVKRVF